ncbi:MAG TPA: hypothetical protein VMF70_14850 [Gemmatimonadales bacterium]|nr:hypothetical protein [Gemmatimonadales bacterium]
MRLVSALLDALLVLLLLVTAYLGLTGGLPLLREAHTAGQWAATATEIGYGVVAVLVLVAWASRHPWHGRLLLVWALALTVTGALAPVVWARTSLATGAVSGAGVGAVLALLLWGRRRARSRVSAP